MATSQWGLPPDIAPPVQKLISGRKYSCIVRDRVEFRDETNDRTEFEPNLTTYIPVSRARVRKYGAAACHQPHIQKRSSKWWKAQCGFRGLAVHGTIAGLQDRLRNYSNAGMCDPVRSAYESMKKEYVRNNLGAIEKMWETSDNQAKLALWPTRLLHENFGDISDASTRVLVVEADKDEKLLEACTELNIHCVLKKVPEYCQGKPYLAILGVDTDSLHAKVAELNRAPATTPLSTNEKKRKRGQSGVEKEPASQGEFVIKKGSPRQEEPTLKQEPDEHQELPSSNPEEFKPQWNVSGKWKISCPYIEEGWGSHGQGCSLEIGLTKPKKDGTVQMYASFDFIVNTGIMRFVNSPARRKKNEVARRERAESVSEGTATSTSNTAKRKSGKEKRAAEQFLLSTDDLPSCTNRKFKYRWRGIETGEGVRWLDTDRVLCLMKFESGDDLSGTFLADWAGQVIEFQGHKAMSAQIASAGQDRKVSVWWPDPVEEWTNVGEPRGYEEARAARWQ